MGVGERLWYGGFDSSPQLSVSHFGFPRAATPQNTEELIAVKSQVLVLSSPGLSPPDASSRQQRPSNASQEELTPQWSCALEAHQREWEGRCIVFFPHASAANHSDTRSKFTNLIL